MHMRTFARIASDETQLLQRSHRFTNGATTHTVL